MLNYDPISNLELDINILYLRITNNSSLASVDNNGQRTDDTRNDKLIHYILIIRS
jgi:hypothetical protein